MKVQMSQNPASAPEATPLHKLRNMWVLAGATYGTVIACTILAVAVYRHYWPNADATERVLDAMSASITVGDVTIPVYPGALHRDMQSSTTGEVTQGDLTFTTADPPEKVIAFYQTRFTQAHFRVTRAATGGTSQVMATRAKSMIDVVATPAAEGSSVKVHTRFVAAK